MFNKLLSFGAKSVNPIILEQTLTVRKEIVDGIEKNCINNILIDATYQSLLIAPRGSGKTHITKVLYHRFKNNKKLVKKAIIAYLAEDEVGIANFTDLLISILRSFIKYKEFGSEQLENQIREASLMTITSKRNIFIKDILLNYIINKKIILLIENFDKILHSIQKNGQANLRDFIHQYNNLCILATSQSLIKSVQDSSYPFYNFFDIQQLKKLNFKESVALLYAKSKSENDNLLLDEIQNPEFQGKLRAIFELTEGNHRLLVTFYSFLKAEFKCDLSEIFIKTMNDLKPYYEQFINVLPAQQQKIVKYLSINRKAISGKIIAQDCFITPNVISKQMSTLFNIGMIDKNKSGKDTFYELKEPLMRISFEISENPNGIAKLFIDFLSNFYEPNIIKKQYLRYKYGAKFQDSELQLKYINEAQLYELALIPKERENFNFFDNLFSNIESIKELDSIIAIVDVSTLKEKIISFKKFSKRFNYNPKNFAKFIIESISLTLEEKNKVVEALPNLSQDQVSELVKVFKEERRNFIEIFGDKLYRELIKYVKKGEFVSNNVTVFLKISKKQLFKDNEFVFYFLGQAFAKEKNYEKAIENYEKAISINPNNIDFHNDLGTVFSISGNRKKAIETYENIISITPEKAKSYFNLGIVYSEFSDFKNAIINIKKAISINPDEVDYYISLGEVFRMKENYAEAIKYYKKAISIDPNIADVYNNFGVICRFQKNYKKAIKNYKKAISINPNDESFYFNLGLVYKAKESYKKAIKNYKKAISINQKKASYYYSLAEVYELLENHDRAILNFKKAILLKPTDADFYNNLGISYRKNLNYKMAIKNYKLAIKIKPKDSGFLYNLALAYKYTGNHKKAIVNYKKAISINSNNINYHQNLAIAYDEIDAYEKAIKCCKEIIKINPDDSDTHNAIGLLYLKINEVEKAFEFFNKSILINPNNLYAKFSILGAYIRINETEKSKVEFEKCIKLAENNLIKVSFEDDIFPNLFKYGSHFYIKDYFKFMISSLNLQDKLHLIWKAFSDTLFNILINIEEYDLERLENILTISDEVLAKYPDSIISLKIFSIGIAHLKKQEKNAIYELSKEERKIFNEFVINKRKNILH
jgi:tetratricopeptide (TPR) repeat protein